MAEKERLFLINSVKRDTRFLHMLSAPSSGCLLEWTADERSVPQRDSGHQGVSLCHLSNSASADTQSGTRG